VARNLKGVLVVTKSRLPRSIAALLVVVPSVAATTAAVAWSRGRPRPKPSVTSPVEAAIRAEGRVVARPGSEITLRAPLFGTVRSVHVVEGQRVSKGDVLLEFDDTEYMAQLGEAFATSNEAAVRLRARATDTRRTKVLADTGALPPTSVDQVVEEKNVAQARLFAAGAEAQRARAVLHKTRLVAPIDGTVIGRSVDPAETVEPGADLLVIANLHDLRIEAEVDELELGRLALGAHVEVTAEAFGGQHWDGTVEEVPLLVGARRLRPQDPSRPTDTGVVILKISYPNEAPLRLGERVNVRIDPQVGGH